MDLDQWISKVKDGQHLSEEELQLLCEYVRHLLLPCLPNSINLYIGWRWLRTLVSSLCIASFWFL